MQKIKKPICYLLIVLVLLLLSNVVCIKRINDYEEDMLKTETECQKLLEEQRRDAELIVRLKDKLSTYDADLVVAAPTPPQYLDIPLDNELQSYVWSLCCNYDIAEYYELIFAVIKTESNFNAAAISSTQDYGLMQINVANHNNLRKALGIKDFLDPYQNIHGGVYLLATLLHKYDVADALIAYNMGEGNAAKLHQRGVHTTYYSETVLKYYREYI